jgi:hypothetical protein
VPGAAQNANEARGLFEQTKNAKALLAQHLVRLTPHFGEPDRRLDAGEEFASREGLHEIVVSARLQAIDLRLFPCPDREQDDRRFSR